MSKTTFAVAVTASILALATAASARPSLHGARYLDQATISLSQARTTALDARPGVIADQQLEKAKGGSGLRYAFDVKSGRHMFAVGVDANTGMILQNRQAQPRWPKEI